ncbi:MAG: hypothetical protein K2Q26_09835 [Bdellovibrionales bacterium]|nr:hypothetical protein [Bdellovibrionales bacterium]
MFQRGNSQPNGIRITPGALLVFVGIGIAFYFYYKNYDYSKLSSREVKGVSMASKIWPQPHDNATEGRHRKVPEHPLPPEKFNLESAKQSVQSQHYFNRMQELSRTIVFPAQGEVTEFEDFEEGKYKEVIEPSDKESITRFYVDDKILLEEWETPEVRYSRMFNTNGEVEMFEMAERKVVSHGETYEAHRFQYLQGGRELKLIDQFGPQTFVQTFFDGQRVDSAYSPDGKQIQAF